MKVQIDTTSNLEECIAFFLDDSRARGQSDATIHSKRLLLAQFKDWCVTQGVHRPSDLDIEELEGYRRHLYQYRKPCNGEPLSLSTQVQRLIAVTTFLKRLYYFRVIHSNFFEYFELPRIPRRLPMDVPDGDELEIVLKQTLVKGRMGLRDRAILEVYNATGIRRSELANLDVRDVDFKYQLLNIRKGKGNRDRRVPIAQRALDWLAKYLKEFRPQLATLESGNALFINQSGKRLSNHKLTDLVGGYIRRSGVRDKGACHVFRHASATNMLRGGADIRYVQEMLGHQHISSTQLYTHVAIGDLSRVYKETHPAAKGGSNAISK